MRQLTHLEIRRSPQHADIYSTQQTRRAVGLEEILSCTRWYEKMEDERAERDLIKELRQKFEALLSSSTLSDDEKCALSNEILKIICANGDEVVE